MRRRRLALVGFVAVATIAAVGCDPPAPPPAPPTGVCRADPFPASFQHDIDIYGAAAHHVTAAVYDDRSGCWYHLRRGQVVTTASVVKIEVMAAAMLRAQDQGRGLTPREGDLVGRMISTSDNAATTTLWHSLGGVRAMKSYGDRLGLRQTTETEPYWGLTATTAEDQAAFVERLVQGGVPLDRARRGLAWVYLQLIRPDQQWGVRAGVPAGWAVGHKNGFADSACCGWRINSVGYVADPAGGGYSIAVLSDGWASMEQGIPMVETVARTVAGSLTS